MFYNLYSVHYSTLYNNSLPCLLLATGWNSLSKSFIQEQEQVLWKSVNSATSSKRRGDKREEGDRNKELESVCVRDPRVELI